jgi:hypothetical protein
MNRIELEAHITRYVDGKRVADWIMQSLNRALTEEAPIKLASYNGELWIDTDMKVKVPAPVKSIDLKVIIAKHGSTFEQAVAEYGDKVRAGEN